MKTLLTWCAAIAVVGALAGCARQSDTLFAKGRAAMKSLDSTSIDTAKVNVGIRSLIQFSEKYTTDPRLDSALFMLASLQGVLGQDVQAAKNFLAVVDMFPNSKLRPNSLILAGHLYEEMKIYDRSKACYEKLIREYPNHEFVKNGSAQALIDHMGEPLNKWLIPFQSDSVKTTKHPAQPST